MKEIDHIIVFFQTVLTEEFTIRRIPSAAYSFHDDLQISLITLVVFKDS